MSHIDKQPPLVQAPSAVEQASSQASEQHVRQKHPVNESHAPDSKPQLSDEEAKARLDQILSELFPASTTVSTSTEESLECDSNEG